MGFRNGSRVDSLRESNRCGLEIRENQGTAQGRVRSLTKMKQGNDDFEIATDKSSPPQSGRECGGKGRCIIRNRCPSPNRGTLNIIKARP